jgi:hypothetical protein
VGGAEFSDRSVTWRNLAGNTTFANVPLIAPESLFEARLRRLDLRLTKMFNVTKRVRLQAKLDAYNALNSSAIQTLNITFGPNWKSPTTIIDPRLLQFSAQLNF